MPVDFSALKGIDFTKPDNLIFLFIFLVIFIIVFLVFLFILIKIVKEIKKIIRDFLKIETTKPEPEQPEKKESADWLKGQLSGNEEPVGAPRQKISGADFIQNFNSGKETPEEEKDIVKIQRAKEQKDVAEGLSKLKSGSSAGQSTVESKMPSRGGDQDQEDNSRQKIIIPRAKRFQGGSSAPNVGAIEKNAFTTSRGVLQAAGPAETQNSKNISNSQPGNNGNSMQGQISREKGSNYQIPGSKTKDNKTGDQSIFKGQKEVSRIKLEYELRKDPKIWQASKQVGLNMSPAERAKLVKQVFSSALGRNISKTDLNQSIKKLNQKMLDTKDQTQHAKIRKEIKFFKKIGGIK